jgi:hypothetical protein
LTQLKEVLEMGVGILIWLATEWAILHLLIRLDFSSKFTSPTLMLGLVAMLVAVGTEKS